MSLFCTQRNLHKLMTALLPQRLLNKKEQPYFRSPLHSCTRRYLQMILSLVGGVWVPSTEVCQSPICPSSDVSLWTGKIKSFPPAAHFRKKYFKMAGIRKMRNIRKDSHKFRELQYLYFLPLPPTYYVTLFNKNYLSELYFSYIYVYIYIYEKYIYIYTYMYIYICMLTEFIPFLIKKIGEL